MVGCMENKMTKSRFPPGWNESRVRRVLEHYDSQSEDDDVEEDEAAYDDKERVFIQVPSRLLPKIRELIAEDLRRVRKSET